MHKSPIRPTYVVTNNTDPVSNIALEAHLLERVASDEVTLYLWQNAHTVVIGRNQDAERETRRELLAQEGGRLVRRLSGGGAVYHDLGNLNFTFLAQDGVYDVDRQLKVILGALEHLGLKGNKSGRNDLEIDGMKFSGNAFFAERGHRYHHGTLLVDVDLQNMARYLVPSARKLKAKGVASVRSRVTNLKALNPSITIESLTEALIKAFGEEYGAKPIELTNADLDPKRLSELEEKIGSEEWIGGSHLKNAYQIGERFDWGELTVSLRIADGKITRAAVDSDAMDVAGVERVKNAIQDALTDSAFTPEEMVTRLKEAQEALRLSRKHAPSAGELEPIDAQATDAATQELHMGMFGDVIRLIESEAHTWPHSS